MNILRVVNGVHRSWKAGVEEMGVRISLFVIVILFIIRIRQVTEITEGILRKEIFIMNGRRRGEGWEFQDGYLVKVIAHVHGGRKRIGGNVQIIILNVVIVSVGEVC